eukprot:1163426-Ditylum_brightwellii.AAC.1
MPPFRHTERRGTGGGASYNNFHRFGVLLFHIGADCGSTDSATVTGGGGARAGRRRHGVFLEELFVCFDFFRKGGSLAMVGWRA